MDSDCSVLVGYDYKLQLFTGFIGCVAQTLVGIIGDVTVLMKLLLPHRLFLKNPEFHVQYTSLIFKLQSC
jgi:hypothetical protein